MNQWMGASVWMFRPRGYVLAGLAVGDQRLGFAAVSARDFPIRGLGWNRNMGLTVRIS